MQGIERLRSRWRAIFSRSALLTIVMAASTTIAGTSPSDGYVAGRYNVEACTAAVSYANHSWTATTNNTKLVETHTACGEEPADYNSDVLTNLELGEKTSLAEEIPVGTSGQWEIVAPTGTTIAEVNGYSSLYRQGRSWRVYRETEDTKGEIDVESSCDNVMTNACRLGGIFQATALNARRMIFGLLCTAEEYEPGKFFTTCPDGALLHDVRAGIAYATVTIADPNPPEAVAVASAPSGSQHGTVDVRGSAVDSTAGLLSLSVVTKAGEVVGGPVTVGACDYSQLTPCPTQASNLSIAVDSTQLPDGEDELRIQATNAAHDTGYSAPFTLMVENCPPEPKEGGSKEISTQETSQGQGGGSPSSSPSEKTSGGPVAGGVSLPTLKVTLKTRYIRRHLIIEGRVSPHAKGSLHLVVRARTRRHGRWWTRKLVSLIRKGRFRATIGLPRLPKTATAKITIFYSASTRFRQTVRHFIVLI